MPAFLSDSIVRGLSGDFQKTPLSQRSAVGATSSLADVLSMVSSRSDLPTFVIAARLVGRHRPVRRGAPVIGSIGAAWAIAGSGGRSKGRFFAQLAQAQLELRRSGRRCRGRRRSPAV